MLGYGALMDTYGTQGDAAHYGRYDAITQSAGVNVQVEPDVDSYRNAVSAMRSDDRYPAGVPMDHAIEKGELALYHPEDQQRHCGSMPGSPQFTVFAALNGRSNKDWIAFLGVVAAGSKDMQPSLASVQVSGSVTISNVGECAIRAGELVMWDYPPEQRLPNGERSPVFDDSDVASRTRFLPVLRPFNLAHFKQAWITANRDIRANKVSKKAAIDKWGVLKHAALRDRDPIGRLYTLLRDGQYTANAEDDGCRTAAAEFKETTTGYRLAVPVASARLVTGADDEKKAEIAVELFCDYMELLQSRIIGRALSHALPKGSLDILINARF